MNVSMCIWVNTKIKRQKREKLESVNVH